MRSNRSAFCDAETISFEGARQAAIHHKNLQQSIRAELQQARADWRAAEMAFSRLGRKRPTSASVHSAADIEEIQNTRSAAMAEYERALERFKAALLRHENK